MAAAAAVQRDVLRMFYVPLPSVALFEGFVLVRNNFREWFHVWRMEPLPERRCNQGDIYRFGRAHNRKFVKVVKKELERLGSIKVSFRLRQEFSRINQLTGEEKIIKHYFEKDQPTIFMGGDSEERIRRKKSSKTSQKWQKGRQITGQRQDQAGWQDP